MQTIARSLFCGCAVLTLVSSGCRHVIEDSPIADCSGFNKTFFSKPTTVQLIEFAALDIETQYAIYICGSQFREPPSIYLAAPFGKQGVVVVGFLKEKLKVARGDLTIHDIILVFDQMNRQDTYDVVGDLDLTRVIEDGVARVKDSFWRQRSARALEEMRQRASSR